MRILILISVVVLSMPLYLQSTGKSSKSDSSVVEKNINNAALLSALRPDAEFIFHDDIRPAADQIYKYLPFIKGKRIGLVVNQTSVIGKTHLVDSLIKLGCNIQKIFAPEHGFRGTADRGEHITDGVDPTTSVKIVSLYGKNLKPGPELMQDLDMVIYDIQDVGVRFYTFTSTMTYMMESCARNKIPMLILDRPNPLGYCVDGPVMEKNLKSFVGLHPVPVVHGLTTAEYARMINGEGWLPDSLKCELYHVECSNYDHRKFYKLPIKPSPNLPNMQSIYLYPSLCLFEGTVVSMGRGTDKQFQVYGHPDFQSGEYEFTPKPGEGDKSPIYSGQKCFGFDLSNKSMEELQKSSCFNLDYLIKFYHHAEPEEQVIFFNNDNFFNKLIGNSKVKDEILNGKMGPEIRKEWTKDLDAYKKLRKKYLLYSE